MNLPGWFTSTMRALIALIGLVAFVLLAWRCLTDVIAAKDRTPPTYSDPFTYFTTAVAALVGGVVAVTFGQPAPPGPPPPNGGVATMSLRNLALVVSFGSVAKIGIGILYVLIYIAFGIAACVVWIANPNEVSAVVKNLAITFAGLALPIAQGFFSDSKAAIVGPVGQGDAATNGLSERHA